VRVIAAVPVKDLVNAKQRLVPVLSPEERHALAASMLEDVLDALAAARLAEICVVTRDAAVIDIARRYGAGCLTESANRGHTEAVAFAQHEALAGGADAFLTIPGDVPCVTGADLRAVHDALEAAPSVVLVPSLSGFGTNAALVAPPNSMVFKFGEPSFDNHVEAARQRGLRTRVLALPGIGLDIDAAEDVRLLLDRGPHTRSALLLGRLGVPDRLASP
jgi:2-phospho-L-lactate guanylyltransferase